MEEIKKKKCPTCGRELPVSEFSKNPHCKDGLFAICKECARASHKKAVGKTGGKPADVYSGVKTADKVVHEAAQAGFVLSSAKKVWYKAELASVSNRDLIEELKARGFKGKLSYVYEIDV